MRRAFAAHHRPVPSAPPGYWPPSPGMRGFPQKKGVPLKKTDLDRTYTCLHVSSQSFQSKCAVGCFCGEFVFINSQMADRNEFAHDEAWNKSSDSPPESFESRRLDPSTGGCHQERRCSGGDPSVCPPPVQRVQGRGGIIPAKIYLGGKCISRFCIYYFNIFRKTHIFFTDLSKGL